MDGTSGPLSVPSQPGGDLGVRGLISVAEELRVHAEQHGHAVAGALCHKLRLHTGAEPRGHRSMTKIIRTLGQRRLELRRGQTTGASLSPDLAVTSVLDQPAPHGLEQPAVGGHAVRGDVPAQQGDQLGRDRHMPDRSPGPVFQSPFVVRLATVCPG